MTQIVFTENLVNILVGSIEFRSSVKNGILSSLTAKKNETDSGQLRAITDEACQKNKSKRKWIIFWKCKKSFSTGVKKYVTNAIVHINFHSSHKEYIPRWNRIKSVELPPHRIQFCRFSLWFFPLCVFLLSRYWLLAAWMNASACFERFKSTENIQKKKYNKAVKRICVLCAVISTDNASVSRDDNGHDYTHLREEWKKKWFCFRFSIHEMSSFKKMCNYETPLFCSDIDRWKRHGNSDGSECILFRLLLLLLDYYCS